jgi:hypothetical protein
MTAGRRHPIFEAAKRMAKLGLSAIQIESELMSVVGHVQPLQAFGVERIELLRWHPEGESDRSAALNASLVSHTDAGVSNYSWRDFRTAGSAVRMGVAFARLAFFGVLLHLSASRILNDHCTQIGRAEPHEYWKLSCSEGEALSGKLGGGDQPHPARGGACCWGHWL